jgi:uncharacterized protein (TIGR02217 family)
MSRFVDVYLPDCVAGYPVYASPKFSTDIAVVDSGREQVNRRWQHPLHRYTLPEVVRDMSIFNAVRAHWLVMGGPAKIFPFRDPFDFASVDLTSPTLEPTISAVDQVLGVGDGLRTTFQITKEYVSGSSTYVRNIYLPVVSSVVVAINGVILETGWTVSREGGEIVFADAPDTGLPVSCGFLFDVSVRFESDDSFDAVVQTFGLGGYSDLTLLETRLC